MKLRDFQRGDVLGKGSSGRVFRAIELKTGKVLAIKHMQGNSESELKDAMFEIALLKNLSHQHIVQFYGYEQLGKSIYLFMEYCELGSLYDFLKKFKFFPENTVRNYIYQILKGLEYIHGEGVIHRDIKCANVLSTKEGIIKLADFGIATKFGSENGNLFLGTPYWLAPEVIEMASCSSAADIWAVGCTAIELLTGAPPYFEMEPISAMFHIVSGNEIPLPSGISTEFSNFLTECFQKENSLRISADRLLNHPWFAESPIPIYEEPVSIDNKTDKNKTINLELYRDDEESNNYDNDFVTENVWEAKIKSNIHKDEMDSTEAKLLNIIDGGQKLDNHNSLMNLMLCQESLSNLFDKMEHYLGNDQSGNRDICIPFLYQCMVYFTSFNIIDQSKIINLIFKLISSSISYALLFLNLFESILVQRGKNSIDLQFQLLVELNLLSNSKIGEERDTVRNILINSKVSIATINLMSELSNEERIMEAGTEFLVEISKTSLQIEGSILQPQFIKKLISIIPMTNGITLLRSLKLMNNICQNPKSLCEIERYGGIELLCKLLQNTVPTNHSNDYNHVVLDCLFKLLKVEKRRILFAINCGVLDGIVLQAMSGSKRNQQHAYMIICEMVCRIDSPKFWEAGVFNILQHIIENEVAWRSTALEALTNWTTRGDRYVLRAIVTKSTIFESLFATKVLRKEIEEPYIGKLVRIAKSTDILGEHFLNVGIMNYLKKLCELSDRKMIIEILRLLSILLKCGDYNYWRSQIKQLKAILIRISSMNSSAVIKDLYIQIVREIQKAIAAPESNSGRLK